VLSGPPRLWPTFEAELEVGYDAPMLLPSGAATTRVAGCEQGLRRPGMVGGCQAIPAPATHR
jgi:hypothetical protein